jgi:hypothetical protein
VIASWENGGRSLALRGGRCDRILDPRVRGDDGAWRGDDGAWGGDDGLRGGDDGTAGMTG